MKGLKSLLVVTLALACATQGNAQTVGVSNITNTVIQGWDLGPASGFQYVANGFSTGAGTGWTISSVDMKITVDGTPNQQISLGLWTDNAGNPGSVIGSFTNVSPTTTGIYSFTPASTLSLASNTAYWLVAEYPTINVVYWAYTDDASETGLPGWTIGNLTKSFNGSWQINGPTPSLFTVNVQAVPEPTTWALMGLGGVLAVGAVWYRRRKNCQVSEQLVPTEE